MSLVFLPGADVEHDFGASFVTWGLRLFRYGEGQIKVMAHHPRFARSLKIIPLIFGWTMLGLLAEYAVSGDHRFLLPALLYVLTITSVSGHLAARERKLGATPALLTWFLVTHFSYSAGEVWGSIRWIVLNMSKWGPNSYRSVWPSTLKS